MTYIMTKRVKFESTHRYKMGSKNKKGEKACVHYEMVMGLAVKLTLVRELESGHILFGVLGCNSSR